MNTANMANVYKNQQAMTAPPEELTLMLYNGALRFVNESIVALEQGHLDKSSNANLRAQDILREFMRTLDMKYEISKNLFSLYDYLEYRLIQGNLKKDKAQLLEAKNMLQELRDTWAQAMKMARMNRPQQQSYAQGV
jgi:flagellar protein FliS